MEDQPVRAVAVQLGPPIALIAPMSEMDHSRHSDPRRFNGGKTYPRLSLHGTTGIADAIPVNAPTLERWYLLQGPAVAISRTTRIYALPFSRLSGREGERGEIDVARIKTPTR
jgi:hypothetical protein